MNININILNNYYLHKLYKPYYNEFISIINLSEKRLIDKYLYCYPDKCVNNYGLSLLRFNIIDYSENFKEFHEIYLEGSTDIIGLVYALCKFKASHYPIVIKFTSLGNRVWDESYYDLLGNGVIL